MQVVFVHGVNTRDSGDGSYDRAVAARDDRLTRLSFGGDATIRNPYWGKYGHREKTLASIPKPKDGVEALGHSVPVASPNTNFVDKAEKDFPAMVATLSVAAIEDASLHKTDDERRQIEDYWMTAAKYADMRSRPSWLRDVISQEDFVERLSAEVGAMRHLRPLGGGWMPTLPSFDFNGFAAAQARNLSSGFMAQFLGDALMFFARRDKSASVRQEVARSIVGAAKAAAEKDELLTVIGHSMGGSILHEILTDQDQVDAIGEQLGRPLKVDLFLSVGTQIGLFAELNQFSAPLTDAPLKVAVAHYWNVYDYNDTLAFLCAPFLAGAVDFEVSTAGGVFKSHGAYFDNAVFFHRLNTRLKSAGLVA